MALVPVGILKNKRKHHLPFKCTKSQNHSKIEVSKFPQAGMSYDYIYLFQIRNSLCGFSVCISPLVTSVGYIRETKESTFWFTTYKMLDNLEIDIKGNLFYISPVMPFGRIFTVRAKML